MPKLNNETLFWKKILSSFINAVVGDIVINKLTVETTHFRLFEIRNGYKMTAAGMAAKKAHDYDTEFYKPYNTRTKQQFKM